MFHEKVDQAWRCWLRAVTKEVTELAKDYRKLEWTPVPMLKE